MEPGVYLSPYAQNLARRSSNRRSEGSLNFDNPCSTASSSVSDLSDRRVLAWPATLTAGIDRAERPRDLLVTGNPFAGLRAECLPG